MNTCRRLNFNQYTKVFNNQLNIDYCLFTAFFLRKHAILNKKNVTLLVCTPPTLRGKLTHG